MISNICREREIDISNVGTIVSDFESVIMNAAEDIFPGVKTRGCFFHFAQAIYRNIQDIGLTAVYRDEESFRNSVGL